MLEQFSQFCEYAEKEDMGAVKPNQVEVSYINDLAAGDGWDSFGELEKAINVWRGEFSDGFLPEPEEARCAMSFVIHDGAEKAIGRLHVSVEPRVRMDDGQRILRLSLTARGAPIGASIDGVKAFLEIGHEWVVKGFASVTTPAMHKVWERTNDR